MDFTVHFRFHLEKVTQGRTRSSIASLCVAKQTRESSNVDPSQSSDGFRCFELWRARSRLTVVKSSQSSLRERTQFTGTQISTTGCGISNQFTAKDFPILGRFTLTTQEHDTNQENTTT